METGHYPKTELEIVTVHDLDGEPAGEFQGRNILREKTFNSELNSLVNQIFNNEKLSDGSPDFSKEYNSSEKNELLLNCEKLIYRLKHSGDINSISSNYNPFNTDINVYDDADDTSDYIKSGLLQAGFSKYQILKYNFYDKAYRNDINFLDSSYSSDMYFNISDPLITGLNDHPEGCVLSPELLDSDLFFSKKFLNKDSENSRRRTFFIIKISSLFDDSVFNETFKKGISNFDKSISPLLLIEINTGPVNNADAIFKSLKESAALPMLLYFLKNSIKFSINNYSFEETVLMIELFTKSSISTNFKSYVITLKNYSTRANIFIFKYYLSKLKKIFISDSLIIRISIDKAVLITSSAEPPGFDTLTEKINSSEEIINIRPFDYNEYKNHKESFNPFL